MILMKTRKTSEKVLAEKFSPDVTELDVKYVIHSCLFLPLFVKLILKTSLIVFVTFWCDDAAQDYFTSLCTAVIVIDPRSILVPNFHLEQ